MLTKTDRESTERISQAGARRVAEACVQLLRERFGAQRVIPFGSSVGDGPWHAASDLDLAVEGLAPEALHQAEQVLEEIVPDGLTVDLVPLESLFPEVRARILGERPMPENIYLGLKARLEDELIGLERVAEGLASALKRAGSDPAEYDVRALATYLDDFYKSIEHLCERVAVTLDGGLPTGDRWHQDLLGQMGQVRPGREGRPALFEGPLLLEVDEYRRFRHRVRHLYGYELKAKRVLSLAQGVSVLVERIRAAAAAFNNWLEARANEEA